MKVVKVDSESNLKVGDIIIEVNREPISGITSFVSLIKSIRETGRKSLLLKVLRDEQSLWITIQFVN